MSEPIWSAADLAALRLAARRVDLDDRRGRAALAAGWPLAERSPLLSAWLDPSRGAPDAADDALSGVLRGWSHYYRAAYAPAGEAFHRAWDRDEGWRSWAALGLGKVASDLGALPTARAWLLTALALARRESDLARMAEALGALGEVFLRGGAPRPALELFDADAALLPPGSEHRLRLQNYRAVALSHLGRPDLAEPVLWEGALTALERAPVSALFSLASLAASALHTGRHELHARVLRTVARHQERLGSTRAPLPAAVLLLCDAVWTDTPLAPAAESLGPQYPLERLWVDALERPSEELERRWLALAERPVPTAPEAGRVSAVDEWMVGEELPAPDLVAGLRGDAGREGPLRGRVAAGLRRWFV